MNMKKILVTLLTLAIIVTGIAGTNNHIMAATAAPIKITENQEFTVAPGEVCKVQLPIIATDIAIENPSIEISAADSSAPFSFGTPTLTMNNTTVNYIYSGNPTLLTFDAKAKDTAKIGNYPINIKFTYLKYTYTDTLNIETVSYTITTNLKITEEKEPAQLTIGNVVLGNSNVGSKTELSFTVENEGEIPAKNTYLTMGFGDIIEGGYTAKSIKIGDLASGDTKKISLPITILSTAGNGRKSITADFTYKTEDGAEIKSTYTIYINLTSVTNAVQIPKLNILDITCTGGLKPGEDFNLKVSLKNMGGAKADNIKASIDASSVDSSGILKNYYTEGITMKDMGTDTESAAMIPLTVSKYATSGLKAVKVNVAYTDTAGNAYTVTDTVYVDITSMAPTPAVGSPNIVISNVKQSPAQPLAGEKVEISFDVENKSAVDATSLKISTEGLSSTTFIPVAAEPYQYYEKLKAGDKIRVSVPLIVSSSIVEGLNEITVKCAYNGGDSSAAIPVRDVKNDGGISKPKLIVSKYSTDVDSLRAGSTFNFTFDLYNTNAAVAAKNITVTVSQADNIFTVTQGSNSFFINKMGPGETVTETLEMKVKSDATTKAYPIEILIEYEYDGAKPNPTTGEIGEKRTEKLNLQAIENARPVIDNVNVYSFDGNVMSGMPATLGFEFYNMGRSALNNVIVKLEGDFKKSDGEMYFIGNAAEGSNNMVEFEVIPNIEGTAKGVLKVTYEDSNGDEVEYSKEFTAEVMPAASFDPGMDPSSGEVFNPEVVVTAKKELLPIWGFILLQVAIFVIFVPVTRKVIISAYKAKLRKKELD